MFANSQASNRQGKMHRVLLSVSLGKKFILRSCYNVNSNSHHELFMVSPSCHDRFGSFALLAMVENEFSLCQEHLC